MNFASIVHGVERVAALYGRVPGNMGLWIMRNDVTLNGVRLSYADIGEGPPLLCLHGGMGIDAGSLHVPGILNLAQRGVRLVIPDQRGHGRSERTHPDDYTHETWVTDARALASTLGFR